MDENSLKRKNQGTVILRTGRFDIMDSAVIISSVSKTNFQLCTALLTLLTMTAESMLSKCPVFRIAVALCFFMNTFVL